MAIIYFLALAGITDLVFLFGWTNELIQLSFGKVGFEGFSGRWCIS